MKLNVTIVINGEDDRTEKEAFEYVMKYISMLSKFKGIKIYFDEDEKK